MTPIYDVAEIFRSICGEGGLVGQRAVFVRLAGCNLHCRVENVGFDCDTVIPRSSPMSADCIIHHVETVGKGCESVVITGGEPMMQLSKDDDDALLRMLHAKGFSLTLETNGTYEIPDDMRGYFRRVNCSPKLGSDIKLTHADEVRMVVGDMTDIDAYVAWVDSIMTYGGLWLSPAWDANGPNRDAIGYIIAWILINGRVTMTVQQHKLWGLR